MLRVVLRGRRDTSARFSKDNLDFRGRCVFFATCIVRAASSGNSAQIALQAWHFVTCDEN